MTKRWPVTVLAAAVGILFRPTVVVAQCRPPATSHEARLLAFYEVPAMFTMASAPERLSPGAITVAAEAIPVPSPDPTLTHPDYCYQNATNNTKLAPVFGRPRAVVGLPAGFELEASYVPPVSAARARVTVASIALSRVQLASSRVSMMYRAHGTIGRVRGPIVCPENSLQTRDAGAPCFGTTPSHDSFDPNSIGAEAALGAAFGRIQAYAGGGATSVRPHFQAGFTDGSGNVDHTTIDVALVRAAAFGGATIHVGNVAISAQVHAVPVDATTLRIGLGYRLR
jgi:hypothetical protein